MRRSPACVALLVACSLGLCQHAEARVVSLKEQREADVIVQKFDISCGAAALATLLHLKFHDDVSEKEVAIGLISREEYIKNPVLVRAREGFSLLDLKRFADQRGYKGEGFGDMTLDDLKELAPAIIALDVHGYNHFVVFRGLVGDKVVLADPAFGNRPMGLDRFMESWINLPDMGRIAFAVSK